MRTNVLNRLGWLRVPLGIGVLISLVSPIPALAQEPLPPAPESRVLDDALIFSDESYQNLTNQIAGWESPYGLRIFVATYRYLLEDTINERARDLHDAWRETPMDVVIVYVRATGELTFAASGNDTDAFLGSDALAANFESAVAAITGDGTEGHGDKVIRFTNSFASATQVQLGQNRVDRESGGGRWFLPVSAGMVGIALLFLILSRLPRRSSQRTAISEPGAPAPVGDPAPREPESGIRDPAVTQGSGETAVEEEERDTSPATTDHGRRFPEVQVGRRLGAGVGGGTIASSRAPG